MIVRLGLLDSVPPAMDYDLILDRRIHQKQATTKLYILASASQSLLMFKVTCSAGRISKDFLPTRR
jgi:hypothetical protein